MADIQITTNGTVEGTTLTVDGKEISKKEKIVSIDLYAHAPYKSQYSGDTIPGQVVVGYDKANEDGTIERKSIISSKDRSSQGIGQKVKNADSVIRYIDHESDSEVNSLVNRIIDHAGKENIVVPTKEDLLNRSVQSLKDKCEDLGINLEDENNPDEGNSDE